MLRVAAAASQLRIVFLIAAIATSTARPNLFVLLPTSNPRQHPFASNNASLHHIVGLVLFFLKTSTTWGEVTGLSVQLRADLGSPDQRLRLLLLLVVVLMDELTLLILRELACAGAFLDARIPR